MLHDPSSQLDLVTRCHGADVMIGGGGRDRNGGRRAGRHSLGMTRMARSRRRVFVSENTGGPSSDVSQRTRRPHQHPPVGTPGDCAPPFAPTFGYELAGTFRVRWDASDRKCTGHGPYRESAGSVRWCWLAISGFGGSTPPAVHDSQASSIPSSPAADRLQVPVGHPLTRGLGPQARCTRRGHHPAAGLKRFRLM